jgi:hypothetical protein
MEFNFKVGDTVIVDRLGNISRIHKVTESNLGGLYNYDAFYKVDCYNGIYWIKGTRIDEYNKDLIRSKKLDQLIEENINV